MLADPADVPLDRLRRFEFFQCIERGAERHLIVEAMYRPVAGPANEDPTGEFVVRVFFLKARAPMYLARNQVVELESRDAITQFASGLSRGFRRHQSTISTLYPTLLDTLKQVIYHPAQSL